MPESTERKIVKKCITCDAEGHTYDQCPKVPFGALMAGATGVTNILGDQEEAAQNLAEIAERRRRRDMIGLWIIGYAEAHNGPYNCVHGGCGALAQKLCELLGEEAEIWSLWDVHDDEYRKLPLVVEGNEDTVKDSRITGLCEIGHELHLTVKYNGKFYDGYGERTLEQMLKDFSCDSPHWFRTT